MQSMAISKITKDYIKKINQGQTTQTQPCRFFYLSCLYPDVKWFPHTKFHSPILINYEDRAVSKITKII